MSAININSVLSASVELRNYVGDRISLAPTKQGVKIPNIAFEFDDSDPVKDLHGVANLKREDWTIYVTDTNFINATAIKNIVVQILSSERTLFTASLQEEDYEKDEEAQTHRFEINYTLFYY